VFVEENLVHLQSVCFGCFFILKCLFFLYNNKFFEANYLGLLKGCWRGELNGDINGMWKALKAGDTLMDFQ
jgi:hypothetical protein